MRYDPNPPRILPDQASRERWLLGEIGTDASPHLAVFGAVDSGKTTFFKQLAASQPHYRHGLSYRYWDLGGLQRLDRRAFWQRFSEVMDPTGDIVIDTPDDLEYLLGVGERCDTTILVLDNWDQARSFGASAIDLVELETLTCHLERREAGRPALGLVLITSFPSAPWLIEFAHRNLQAGLRTISGCLERRYRYLRFEMLRRTDAAATVRAFCDDDALAQEVADDCGGWYGLLRMAGSVVASRRATSWDADCRNALFERVPELLGKTLLPECRARYGVSSDDEAWLEVVERIERGRLQPKDYALPFAFGSPLSLAPALRDYDRPPRYLLVDSENIRVGFKEHARWRPADYPGGVEDYMRSTLGPAISGLARDLSVRDQDVILIGKTQWDVDEAFGHPLPWKVEVSGRSGRNSTDDHLICTFVVEKMTRDPRTMCAILTADGGIFSVMRVRGVERLHALLPFRLTKDVLASRPPGWTVEEHVLSKRGVREPERPPRSESTVGP